MFTSSLVLQTTDLLNKDYKTLTTEIGSLTDYLVALTLRVVKVEDKLSRIQHSLASQANTISKLNGAQDCTLTRLDLFTTEHEKAKARLNWLQDVPTTSVLQTFIPDLPLIDSFPMYFLTVSATVPGHSGYNPPSPQLYELDQLPPPLGGADDGSVLGLHRLETDIDAFRTVIGYRCYDLTSREAYIDHDADLSLQKLKRKAELLSETLKNFSDKEPLERLGFLSSMTESFNGQRLRRGLMAWDIELFIAGSTI